MPITDSAVVQIVNALAGVSYTSWATAYIGVGDSSAAFDSSQTDLQASTNKLRKPATLVSQVGSVVTYTATFDETEANWPLNEWAVFNSAGVMLVRKVESLLDKQDFMTLDFEATVTFS